MNPRSSFMKLIAGTVVFTFLITSLGITPETFAANSLSTPEVSSLTNSALAVPAEFGQVTATVIADPSAPAFIHIQSAHGNYQAEKNIEKLLGYIAKSSSIKLMMLEGAAGKLHPEIFRIFPESPDFNRKVTDKLMQEGYLTGPESFLIGSNNKAEGWGIEDLKAYKKDREEFISVVRSEKTAQTYLRKFRASIDDRFAGKLNKDLLTFVRQGEAFDSGTLSFEGWLKSLHDASKKYLKLDLSDAFYQDQYPFLIRYYRLQAIGSKIDREKARQEADEFLKELAGRKVPAEVIGSFKALLQLSEEDLLKNAGLTADGYSTLRRAFDNAFEKLPKNFSMTQWPDWTRYAQFIILMQEMEGKGLHEEAVRLKDKIQAALAKTPEEKAYLTAARELYLLRRLLSLELTRSEYEEIQNRSSNPGPRSSFRDLGTETGDPRIQPVFQTAMSFYSTAVDRENKMFANALAKMAAAKEKRAVIVTGGFHADGLRKLAESRHCSYIQITPRINKVTSQDHEIYLRSILGTGNEAYALSSNVSRVPSPESRDASASEMSALLGIADNTQRVTVTGVATAKAWALDIRSLVSGLINSETENTGLKTAFSKSIFGSPAPALASTTTRSEVRLKETVKPRISVKTFFWKALIFAAVIGITGIFAGAADAVQPPNPVVQTQIQASQSAKVLSPEEERRFQKAMKDLNSSWAQERAIDTLGELKDPRAVSALVNHLRKKTTDQVLPYFFSDFKNAKNNKLQFYYLLYSAAEYSSLERHEVYYYSSDKDLYAEKEDWYEVQASKVVGAETLARQELDSPNQDIRKAARQILKLQDKWNVADEYKFKNVNHPIATPISAGIFALLISFFGGFLVKEIVSKIRENVRIKKIDRLFNKGSDSVPNLIEILEKDKSEKVQAAAAYALGELKAVEAVPALIKILEKEWPWGVPARALEKIGDPRAADILKRYEKHLESLRSSSDSGLDDSDVEEPRFGESAGMSSSYFHYSRSEVREETKLTSEQEKEDPSINRQTETEKWNIAQRLGKLAVKILKVLGRLVFFVFIEIPGAFFDGLSEVMNALEAALPFFLLGVLVVGILGWKTVTILTGIVLTGGSALWLYVWIKGTLENVRIKKINQLVDKGSDSIPDLIKVLKIDKSRRVRAAAVEALGVLKAVEAVPVLMGVLKDNSYWLGERRTVARALKKIDDPRSTEALQQFDKEEEMRESSISSGSSDDDFLYDTKSPPPFIGMHRSEVRLTPSDREARNRLKTRLGRVEPPLLRKMSDETATVILGNIVFWGGVYIALVVDWIEFLVASSLDMAIFSRPVSAFFVFAPVCVMSFFIFRKILIATNVIDRVNWNIRKLGADDADSFWAIKKLGELQDLRAVPALTKMLKSKNKGNRSAAILSLYDLGERALIAEQITSEYPEVVAAALEVMVQLRGADAKADLIQALNNKDNEVRKTAIELLVRINAQDEIAKKVSHPYEDVQVAAIRVLKHQKNLPLLREQMNSKYPDVRSEAVAAIGELKDEKSIPELVNALNDDEFRVRKSAINGLRNLNALTELAQALNNEDSDVRLAAVAAIVELKDAAFVPVLMESLKDEYRWSVGDAAAEALKKFNDPRAASVLEEYEKMREKERENEYTYDDNESRPSSMYTANYLGRSEVRLTPEQVSDIKTLFGYLAERTQDVPQNPDILIVLGNPHHKITANGAVEAFLKYLPKRILVSGKGTGETAEAVVIRDLMTKELKERGFVNAKGELSVPLDIETNSMNTGENAKFSAEFLQKQGAEIANAVLVQMPTGMLLSRLIFEKQFNWKNKVAFYSFAPELPAVTSETKPEEINFWVQHAVGQIERLNPENPKGAVRSGFVHPDLVNLPESVLEAAQRLRSEVRLPLENVTDEKIAIPQMPAVDTSSLGAKIGTAILMAANTVSPLISSTPAFANEIKPQLFAGTVHYQKAPVVPSTFTRKWPVFNKIISRFATASTERMVIDQRRGVPDAASVLPLVTFALYNPKIAVVLALIANAYEVSGFEKELAALSRKGSLPQNFKVRSFADENEFVGAFAGLYNNAAPLGQSIALITDREDSVVTRKIGSRRHLLSVVGAQDSLKQTASTLLAADKLLDESVWSRGYHFVSVDKLGGLDVLMAELTNFVAAQAKVLVSA